MCSCVFRIGRGGSDIREVSGVRRVFIFYISIVELGRVGVFFKGEGYILGVYGVLGRRVLVRY